MMNKYLSQSKNIFYGFIAILPLIILYQLLGFINNYKSPLIIKNGADVYIKNFFEFLGGNYANIAYSISLLLLMFFIFFKNRDLFISSEIKLLFLFGIIFESLIHSTSLIVLMTLLSDFLPPQLGFFSNHLFEKIYLSIGAGLWEELLFRYIIISLLVVLFTKIIDKVSFFSYLIIVIISSSMFSYYHFLGPNGDLLNLSVFIYRFLAGIILSILFIFRGLGVTIYTHTFYDLYLVIFIT